jgi:epoxyqueuosine reductase
LSTDLKIWSETIKLEAKRLGFDDCGIAKADTLPEDHHRLLQWLNSGYQADMSYMERNIDKRADPRLLSEGIKSIIVVILNYFPEKPEFKSDLKIAKYAYGNDYHTVIKDKLYALLLFINENLTSVKGRCFTDSAPVMERSWAVNSGLGWIGKNGNLLTRNFGSYILIGEILVDIELDYDTPNLREYCGSCNICLEKCPTQAIVSPKVIDSRKCISYLTIENKKEIPQTFSSHFQNWIFGCDICQDVCPWNRKSISSSETAFSPSKELLNMTNEDWNSLSEKKYTEMFKASPISRTGHQGLMRNIRNISKKSQIN